MFDEFTLSLSEDNPDYWTFFHVSNFQGKTLTVEAENLGKQQAGFDKIFPDETFRPLNSAEKQVKAFTHAFNGESKSILKKLEIYDLNSVWLENREGNEPLRHKNTKSAHPSFSGTLSPTCLKGVKGSQV